MKPACRSFHQADITVMAAAVADYTPAEVAAEKIKKTEDQWSLSFSKTKDILRSLGEQKKNGQVLVGFALETNNEKVNAKGKLASKHADIIVLNSLRDEGSGFGHDTNKISVFDARGGQRDYETKSKEEVAEDIVDAIILYNQHG